MNKPDCQTQPVFSVHVNSFCSCGWLMILTENGVTYCENPHCERRAEAYNVIVKFEAIKGYS